MRRDSLEFCGGHKWSVSMINCASFFYHLSTCIVLFFSLFGICWFVVVPGISNVSLPCHLEGMARPLAVTDRVAWEQLVKEVGRENWLEVFAVAWAVRTQPRQVVCFSYSSALLLCIDRPGKSRQLGGFRILKGRWYSKLLTCRRF